MLALDFLSAIFPAPGSRKSQPKQKEPSMSKKKPMLEIYSVQEPAEGSDKKPFYTKVAVIWPHEKGDGGNLEVIPGVALIGRLVAFPPREKSQEEAA
jgi:hypothetical protein